MSIHQTNKDKPRAQKCRHFCFSFDLHNYCPTCREAGKGDDPCVTFETPCDIYASFNAILKNKRRKLVQKMMNLISWAKATGIPSLAQMQTSRVLLTIFLPHPPPPVLSPFLSVLYHLKHHPNLSHPPQVLPCKKNLKKILKNHWAIL